MTEWCRRCDVEVWALRMVYDWAAFLAGGIKESDEEARQAPTSARSVSG